MRSSKLERERSKERKKRLVDEVLRADTGAASLEKKVKMAKDEAGKPSMTATVTRSVRQKKNEKKRNKKKAKMASKAAMRAQQFDLLQPSGESSGGLSVQVYTLYLLSLIL